MQDVVEHSNGLYKLGPGTLYDNLQKLMDQRLVEEVRRKGANEDPRRRYYGLTPLGQSTLSADVERLANVVREAQLRLKPVAGGLR
jgi:DNA-binding PadR family transcriptional regulator